MSLPPTTVIAMNAWRWLRDCDCRRRSRSRCKLRVFLLLMKVREYGCKRNMPSFIIESNQPKFASEGLSNAQPCLVYLRTFEATLRQVRRRSRCIGLVPKQTLVWALVTSNRSANWSRCGLGKASKGELKHQFEKSISDKTFLWASTAPFLARDVHMERGWMVHSNIKRQQREERDGKMACRKGFRSVCPLVPAMCPCLMMGSS